MSKSSKRPFIAGPLPRVDKTPRVAPSPDNPRLRTPVWRVCDLDLEGDWGWGAASEDALRRIVGELKSLESMRWVDIESRKHTHTMPVTSICAGARARLRKIKNDDVDSIFQLQIGKQGRLFGIRQEHVFRILWWDPEHTVYPTNY